MAALSFTCSALPEQERTSKTGISSLLKKKNEGDAESVQRKRFNILKDFLQPDSKLTANHVADALLLMLPASKAGRDDENGMSAIIVDLSEQIPYHHPSQLKLAHVVQIMGTSSRLQGKRTSPEGVEYSFSHSTLGEYLHDNMTNAADLLDEDEPMDIVNYHAFLAHLQEVRAVDCDPTWAMWAMRDAFEEDIDSSEHHGITILAAAQWILWYGQSFFQGIRWHDESLEVGHAKSWKFGPRYEGKGLLDRSRWDFWETGFQQAAGNEGHSAECRGVASRAAELMQVIGKTLSF